MRQKIRPFIGQLMELSRVVGVAGRYLPGRTEPVFSHYRIELHNDLFYVLSQAASYVGIRQSQVLRVAWWHNGFGVGLAIRRSRFRLPIATRLRDDSGKLLKPLCSCHPAA